MKKSLNNEYYLLRHGKNIHQTEKKDIVYGYPDDIPPCCLIEKGIEESKEAGQYLKDKGIDLIICSDTLRTRQTAAEVASVINHDKEKIIYDARLRDSNWGVFCQKDKKEVWNYYDNDKIRAFEIAPPEGESWNDCRNRVIECLDELEKKYDNKTILIVSHSNPLWLLEGTLNGLSDQELLDGYSKIIKTGEVRKI
ncbi:MAG: histidine phosphatase family protein [Candidatus Pacebacteria bacterium]|nr:histidine phosphatase family protein [Candidatus Paceibacterota bacterium]